MTAKLPSSSDLLQSALREQYGVLSRDIEHPGVLAGFLYAKKVISKADRKSAIVLGLPKDERTCAVLDAVEDCLTDSGDPLKVMDDFCTALESCKEPTLKESVAYLRAQIAKAQKQEMECISLAGDKDGSPTRKKAEMVTMETVCSLDKSDIVVMGNETTITGKHEMERGSSDDDECPPTKKLVVESHVGDEKKEESSDEREEPQKSTDAAPKHELEHSSSTDDGNGSPVRKNADKICGKHKMALVSSDDETPPTKKLVVKSHVSDDEKKEISDESEEPQKSADTVQSIAGLTILSQGIDAFLDWLSPCGVCTFSPGY